MREWIMELCPEIAEWQAELIEDRCLKAIAMEREHCAKICEDISIDLKEHAFQRIGATRCAKAIRSGK